MTTHLISMKNRIALCLTALILLVLPITSHLAQKQDLVLIDKIVAVVDDSIILASELDAEYAKVIERIKKNKSFEMPDETALRKQVLENLIIRQLQISDAKRRGITVDDYTLNESLRNIAANNKLSLEGFRQKLIADGYDYVQFREELRDDLMVNRLRRGMVYSRVSISEDEAKDFLKAQKSKDKRIQYLLSHIQVSIPDAANAETIKAIENKIIAIYQRLNKGENFAKIALTESDSQSALEGGDLGWLNFAQIPSLFVNEVQSLAIGDISKPIRAPRAFHIIKLNDTQGIKRRIVKQVNARHILMETDTLRTDEKVRKELLDIRQQIIDGEDFGELASTHSKDAGSSANGGKLGWSEPKAYVPEFARVLNSLPVNKISEPFKSQYGWHIVEVLSWRDYDQTADYELDQAYQILHEQKARLEEELWLRRLRDEAYVELRLPDEDDL